jgi:hypothetical protein
VAVKGTDDESDDKDARRLVEFACEVLGDRLGTAFVLDPDRPDDCERERKAIDFTAKDPAGHVLGIEHTRIEPHAGYIRDMNVAEQRLGDLPGLLEGRLLDDSLIEISFAPGTVNRMRRKEAQAIADWVVEVVPTLSIGGGGRMGHFATSPKRMFAVPLTLYRWPRQASLPQVVFGVGIDTDTHTEKKTKPRIDKAVTDKLPKLESSRIDLGARWTLLCLETNDWQMTNPWSLARLIADGSQSATLPDHIVLVMRSPDGSLAYGCLLRVSGQWLNVPAFYRRG